MAGKRASSLSTMQVRAARLLAEGKLTDEQIAGRCNAGVRTLYYWKNLSEFAARVAEIRADLDSAELVKGIASRERRVAKLDARQQALEQVIEERAADETMQKIPGGTSGLVVRKYKMIGFGKQSQRVEEYEVDVATLRELREIEKQAAIELGQWTEKRELAGQGGGPITVIEVRGQGMGDGGGGSSAE